MKELLLILCGFVTYSAFSQKHFVTVDSTRIWVNTIGIEDRKAGQPVVVFENGHGVPMDNWDRILAGVSELVPLVTYDRPGIGQSEAVDEIPTMENVSNRLVSLLDELGLQPPYLLVGHSLGGLYVRGFAVYHPEKLAGLVMIDPADFTETHQNKRLYYDSLNWDESKVDSLIASFVNIRKERHQKAVTPVRLEGQYLEEVREGEFQEISQNELPNAPVHILTGGRFDLPENLRFKDYDREAVFRSKLNHRIIRWTEVVQSVDKGMFFYSANAGHYVQWDDPALVVASIKIALEDYALLKQNEED